MSTKGEPLKMRVYISQGVSFKSYTQFIAMPNDIISRILLPIHYNLSGILYVSP